MAISRIHRPEILGTPPRSLLVKETARAYADSLHRAVMPKDEMA